MTITSSEVQDVQRMPFDPPSRPWLSLYNVMLRPKGMRARDEIGEVELAPIQVKLPNEMMLAILGYLNPYTLGKVACVCQQWRVHAESPRRWEQACREALATKQDISVDRATVLKHFNGSWKRMFLKTPHCRFDGIYVCRNTYIRTGVVELQRHGHSVHLVSYYRYFRFLQDGTFLYRTTPQPLKAVHKSLRGGAQQPRARDDSVFRGRYLIKGSRVFCVVVYPNSRSTEVRSILAIRSTHPGANNRLDIERIYSFDRDLDRELPGSVSSNARSIGSSRPLHPDEPQGEGEQRAYSRGLAPGVFVPWEQVATTPLNLPPREMDFYLAG